jgi:hypothetical protein
MRDNSLSESCRTRQAAGVRREHPIGTASHKIFSAKVQRLDDVANDPHRLIGIGQLGSTDCLGQTKLIVMTLP